MHVPVANPYDAALLERLTDAFPITPRPFAAIGRALGAPDDEVILDAARLLGASPADRPIKVVLAPEAFGFESALVIAAVPASELWFAERVLQSHPGVSHSIIRDHHWSVWFSLSVPRTSSLGLDGTVRRLGELMSAASIRRVDALGHFGPVAGEWLPTAAATPGEQEICRVLSGGLRIEAEPFAEAAAALDVSQEVLIEEIQDLRRACLIRRLGASPRLGRPVTDGVRVLAAWSPPSGLVAAVGARLAEQTAIALVVHRRTHVDWPNALVGSGVGRDVESAKRALLEASEAASAPRPTLMRTLRSHKRARVVFDVLEYEVWERMHSR